MWRYSTAVLWSLISLSVNAQQIVEIEKPVICSDPKTVIENISKLYKESPYWVGVGSDDSKYVLMTNPATKSWTMIQLNDKIACVVGTGDRAHLINLGKKI